MDMKISLSISAKDYTNSWINILILSIVNYAVFTRVQAIQVSEYDGETNHYGTEFILGMTDNERMLHVASEQNGVYSISFPDSSLLEKGYLTLGITQIHLPNTYAGIRKGLHVATSVPVSIVISDKELESNNGAFLALPSNFMGTFYMVPVYKERILDVFVIAVKDNASIAIFRSIELNKTKTVVLSKMLDTFTYIGYEKETTNAFIVANTSVSIIVESSNVDGGLHSSVFAAHMLPCDAWTNEYIVPPLPQNIEDMIRIMSTEEQTVCINGKQNETCFDIKPTTNTNLLLQSENPFTIKSNTSISVVLSGVYTCNQTDNGQEALPFMILVPGISNYLNRYSFVIPDFKTTNDFVVVMIQSSKVSGLMFDGTPFAFNNSFNVNTTNGEFVILIKSVSVGYHIMYHSIPGVRFGALAYGMDEMQCTSTKYRSYGFALGYSFKRKRTDVTDFDTWTSWTICSVSCGQGVQNRQSVCPVSDSTCKLNGILTETRRCNSNPCPENGGFSSWTSWSDCSVTCKIGVQLRSRKCDNPIPSNGGNSCFGYQEEARTCSKGKCLDVSDESNSTSGSLWIVGITVAPVFIILIIVAIIVRKRCFNKNCFAQCSNEDAQCQENVEVARCSDEDDQCQENVDVAWCRNEDDQSQENVEVARYSNEEDQSQKNVEVARCSNEDDQSQENVEVARCSNEDDQSQENVEVARCSNEDDQSQENVEVARYSNEDDQSQENVEVARYSNEEDQSQENVEVARCSNEEDQSQENVEVARCSNEDDQCQENVDVARCRNEDDQSQENVEVARYSNEDDQSQENVEVARYSNEEDQSQENVEVARCSNEDDQSQENVEVERNVNQDDTDIEEFLDVSGDSLENDL